MPRSCSVCCHDGRKAMDEALVAGESLRAITKRFPGVTESSLSRHRVAHLSPSLQKLVADRALNRNGDLLEQLRGLIEKVYQVLEQAEATGKPGVMLAAVREAKSILELQARMTGELDERPQTLVVNLTSTTEWLDVRTRLLAALRPFPEAHRAVIAALGGDSDRESARALAS